MDVLSDLLRIKVFREQKAERALARARELARQADLALEHAKRALKDYKLESSQKEKALYADLCTKIVLLNAIENVLIDVQLMQERIELLRTQVQEAEQKREEAAQHERAMREEHMFAVRMREKFSEMLAIVKDEQDFENARFEESELEEAAEGTFAFKKSQKAQADSGDSL
jgi:hypothetical protein